jgi:cytochrome P450
MQVDLFSRHIVKDPYPILKAISAQGDVAWSKPNNTWMVVGDAACRAVLRDTAHFTVEGSIGAQLFGEDAFISMDDRTQHDRLRNVWAAAFHYNAIEKRRPQFAALADRLFAPIEARLKAGDTVDMVSAFCAAFPAYVIAQILGIDEQMQAHIVEWSDHMGNAARANGDLTSPYWIASEAAKASFGDYLIDQIKERRARPDEGDLISQLVHSEVGKTLSDRSIMVNCRQLLFAGNETTAKWIAQSMVNFARHPPVLGSVVADRRLIPATLEEVMRWDPVVHMDPRIVRGSAARVGDTEMAEGDNVALLFGGANRDERRYTNADVFDIRREQKSHLGFGYGLHICLGQVLARVEAAVAINRFLDAAPDYALTEPIEYGNLYVRGPVAVPIALH